MDALRGCGAGAARIAAWRCRRLVVGVARRRAVAGAKAGRAAKPRQKAQAPRSRREGVADAGRRRGAPASARTRRIRDLDRQPRRRRRVATYVPPPPRKVVAAASAPDARAGRRARAAAERGRRVREGRQGLPRRHHAHRPAPLRRQATRMLAVARRRDRRREEGPARSARRGDQAPRRVRRPATAAPTPTPRTRPTRCSGSPRSTRSARAATARRSLGRAQAGDRPLQARHPRVPEVPRARRHLLLPRPRAQRLEPHRRGAAGLALARLPQPVPVPGPARSQGSRARTRSCRLPQDHDEDFWRGWENAHPTPIGFSAKAGGAEAAKGKQGRSRSPVAARRSTPIRIPTSCTAIPQQTDAGAEPRYVAEVWWQIGNWHFDQLDPHGGPLQPKPRREGVPAVDEVQEAAALRRRDVQARLDVLQAAALRDRASASSSICSTTPTSRRRRPAIRAPTSAPRRTRTSPARSRTSTSQGPAADDPYIARNDVLDTEPNPTVAEQKMHVAIDRVQDPKLIPQDKKWTFEIYKALAQEFRELNQWHNAIEVERAHPQEVADEPRRARTCRTRSPTSTKSSRACRARARPSATQNARKRPRGAHQARRTTSATRRGSTPTRTIPRRSRPPSGSCKRRPAPARPPTTRTSRRAYVGKAIETSDAGRSRRSGSSARSPSTSSPTSGWTGYLRQDENAPDAYESRFWLADARHGVVVGHRATSIDRRRRPKIDNARQAAVDVRDSNEDDKFLAARGVLRRRRRRAVAQRSVPLFARTSGAQGIEKRKEVRFVEDGRRAHDQRGRRSDPAVRAAGDGRARRVRAARAAGRRRPEERASSTRSRSPTTTSSTASSTRRKARFEPIWKEHCGKDEYGYKAWEKLITIAATLATTSKRAVGSPRREEQHCCAVNAEQMKEAKELTGPVKIGGAYIDAGNALHAKPRR